MSVWLLLLCVVAVGSALAVVLDTRAPMNSALYLVVCMIAVAGLYLTLHAQFMGLIQVLVYAGAIVVLFLFVIMLLGARGRSLGPERQPGLKALGLLLVTGAALWFGTVLGRLSPAWEVEPEGFGTTRRMGELLYGDYVLVVQVAAMLLLAGIVGAVVLAKRRIE